MAGKNIPRILVAGANSGAGKTVISVGLMQAFFKEGKRVAPFKVGPDYIDPMFHKMAASRASRNLDGYLMKLSTILESFSKGCVDADIAVVEGVMGLYDSVNGLVERGSTAEIAKIIRSPVILVVDVRRMARSAAALVSGYSGFDPKVNIKGVVLNRVGSKRHGDKAREAVEKLAGIEVVGTLPKDLSLHLPERHLGLVPIHEIDKDIEPIGSFVEKHLDLGRIYEIARSAEDLNSVKKVERKKRASGKKVGVVFDSAFRFYYPETLEQLSESASLVFIDALKDKKLPEIDVLYIGGGFPEVFSRELERNASLRNDIYDFCSSGKKVYAECGGLMYLGERINTLDGGFEMVGFLPLETEMQDKYVGMGYTKNVAVRDNILSRRGEVIFGHEFHHSRVRLKKKVAFAFKTERGFGIDGFHDGLVKENVLASYMHIHPLGYRSMVKNLLNDPV